VRPKLAIWVRISLVAIAVTGCSRGSQTDARRTPGSGASTSVSTSKTDNEGSATATTQDLARYSFEPNPTAPALDDTGSDVAAIAKSLLHYADWLSAFNPDPRLVQGVAAPSSTFDSSVRHDIGILHRLDRRYYEIESAPSEARVLQAREDTATIKYTQHIVVQRVVDRNNKVASEQKFTSPTTSYIVVLVRVSSRRWLIADVEPEAAP